MFQKVGKTCPPLGIVAASYLQIDCHFSTVQMGQWHCHHPQTVGKGRRKRPGHTASRACRIALQR